MKPRVYIIHGWTYSLDKWSKLIEVLKADGIEPIQLNVPGLTEPSNKVWTMDDYLDWLKDSLKDQEKPTLVGHSNGGRIALAFNQKYPGVLGKLILIDSAGTLQNQPLKRLKRGVLKLGAKIGRALTKSLRAKKVLYKLAGSSDYLNAPPNMKLTMSNMLAADKDIKLSLVDLPTAIIWGRQDKLTPLSDGRKMHQAIASSELFVIEDARHAPFFNHPEQVAKIIKQFSLRDKS